MDIRYPRVCSRHWPRITALITPLGDCVSNSPSQQRRRSTLQTTGDWAFRADCRTLSTAVSQGDRCSRCQSRWPADRSDSTTNCRLISIGRRQVQRRRVDGSAKQELIRGLSRFITECRRVRTMDGSVIACGDLWPSYRITCRIGITTTHWPTNTDITPGNTLAKVGVRDGFSGLYWKQTDKPLWRRCYVELEIRSVERGICPIATSTMNELFL